MIDPLIVFDQPQTESKPDFKSIIRAQATAELAKLRSQKADMPAESSATMQETPAGSTQGATGPVSSLLGRIFPVSQKFGNKSDVERFSKGVNYGTDFAAPTGTPIALPPGKWKIVSAFTGDTKPGYVGNATNSGYGNSIVVQNVSTGERLRFSHLSRAAVSAGETISGGVIGYTGTTGNVTGPHLDLEYRNQQGQLADVLQSRYAKFLQ